MTARSIRVVSRLGPAACYRSDITGDWLVEDAFGNVREAQTEVAALLDLYAPLVWKAKPPSERQQDVLHAILDSVAKTGSVPTLAAIAEVCKLRSLASVHEHVTYLEKKGWLRRTSDKPHIRLTPAALEVLARRRQRSRAP